ncbi:MAG: HNH endonuclease [Lachnospiraceae bacterium]|nr:HNH endonuclease [Lachnospiraceae bacterium]
MVKIERTPVAPVSLAAEKVKNGSYTQPDVIHQLYKDFQGKCYLCEMDELQSAEVEHLTAHRGNVDLKFDWNNLFLSCRHCNSMKNAGKYDMGIIDCCKEEPEVHLNYTFAGERVDVQAVDCEESTVKTAALLTECFEKRNTGIRQYTCDVRVRALKLTMTVLYKTLASYEKGTDAHALEVLKVMLDRSYKFAGFTRAYVRAHIDTYPELEPYVVL